MTEIPVWIFHYASSLEIPQRYSGGMRFCTRRYGHDSKKQFTTSLVQDQLAQEIDEIANANEASLSTIEKNVLQKHGPTDLTKKDSSSETSNN